jgi:hypothetical protein
MKIPSDAIGSCPRVAPAGDAHEVDIFVLDTHVMLSDHSIRDDALIDDGRVHTLELYTDACRDVPETKGRPLRLQPGLFACDTRRRSGHNPDGYDPRRRR